MQPQIDDLKKYLLDEADFARSWTDGRRGGPQRTNTPEYTASRISDAETRERWAQELDRLLATEAAARKTVTAFEALGTAQHAGALLMARGNCETAMVALKAALFNTTAETRQTAQEGNQ